MAKAILRPFTYWAPVDYAIDGDTLHAIYIDQGLGNRNYGLHGKGWGLRTMGCNSWEIETVAGKAAKLAVSERLNYPTPIAPLWVKIATAKPDPYVDRLDADIELDGELLTTWLIKNQWAAPWDGVTQPRPTPPWPRTI